MSNPERIIVLRDDLRGMLTSCHRAHQLALSASNHRRALHDNLTTEQAANRCILEINSISRTLRLLLY